MTPTPEMSPQKASAEIDAAVSALGEGGVVVIPTDTLYGLAADVQNLAALEKIFQIKGRPADLALPVLVGSVQQVYAVSTQVSELAQRLIQKFWPGPLTLVVPKATQLSSLLTGGKDTVAVRMPDHQVPLQLAQSLGSPVTGTSANRSGQPDLLTIGQIEAELGRSIDYIIKTGTAPLGIGSTVVDVCGDTPKLLREGALPFDQVLAASLRG